MARLARLRKQRKFLLARKREITRRSLRYLKDLDDLEEKEELEMVERERAEKESPEKTLGEAPPNPSLALDDPALAAALADFDPSNPFWATLDFGGGSP